jgi:hypothetical protein
MLSKQVIVSATAAACVSAEAVGINPRDAAAAAPKPTADQIDGNRISSIEEKTAEGPFLRRETVSQWLGQPSDGSR